MTSTIEFIETEKGNSIIDALKADGWKLVKQYHPLAFDKGIDFDSYTLRKNGAKIAFEWTNWFEWSVSGDHTTISEIAQQFSLELKE